MSRAQRVRKHEMNRGAIQWFLYCVGCRALHGKYRNPAWGVLRHWDDIA